MTDEYDELVDEVVRRGPADMHGSADLLRLTKLSFNAMGKFRTLIDVKLKGVPGAAKLESAVRSRLATELKDHKEKKRKAEAMAKVAEREDAGSYPIDLEHPQAVGRSLRGMRRPHLMYNNGAWMDYRINCYVTLEPQAIDSAYGLRQAWLRRLTGAVVKAQDRDISNIRSALKGVVFRDRTTISPPCWLNETTADVRPRDVLACRNYLIHVPTETAMPLDPRFYTLNGLEFDYQDAFECPPATQWLRFLDDVWDTDPSPSGPLQETFGYL